MDNTITFRKETPEISHEELLQDLKKQEMEAVAKRDYYEAQKIKNKMDNIEAKLEMKTKNPSKGIPSMASEKAFKALLEKEKQQDHKEKQEKTGNLMEQLNEPDDNQLPDMSEIQRNKRAFYEKIGKPMPMSTTSDTSKKNPNSRGANFPRGKRPSMKFEGKTSDERKEEMRERQKGSKWKQESEHKTTLDVSNFHKDIYFNGEKLGEINSGNLEIAKLPKGEIKKTFGTYSDGSSIDLYINNDALSGVLLARNNHYLFRGSPQDKFFVLAKVGDFYLPFYKSAFGTDGKNRGDRYPFFGTAGIRFIKGSIESNGDMLYSPEITKVQNLLNDNLKIPDGEISGTSVFHPDGTVRDENDNILYTLADDFKYSRNSSDQFVQDITGYSPQNVVNDGYGSSDTWMENIMSLIEGKRTELQP